MQRILVANRGEIAIRIARAAKALGHGVIMVAPEDDARSRHLEFGDNCLTLPGRGAGAYLDILTIVAAAKSAGATAIHPGYGFLSESATFSQSCEEAGLVFIGPSPAALRLLGDKSQARATARSVGAPVPLGVEGPLTPEAAEAFFASLESGRAMMLKAVSGGGGRGTRPVREPFEIRRIFETCQKEALAALGSDALYAEELIECARHVEVQILRDRYGETAHAFERECTLQRRRQKLIEIAPSPSIDEEMRRRLITASMRIADAVDLVGLGTFEYLVRPEGVGGEPFVFIEANPRLQVEHTVTEEITGVDLVQTQIGIAFGARLEDLGVKPRVAKGPRGFALQLRINAESISEDGSVFPAGGELCAFEPPTGPGVRIDSCGHAGYRANPAYDSLLAKLIVHVETTIFDDVIKRAQIALDEFRLVGLETNQAYLAALLAQPDVAQNRIDTEYIDRRNREIVEEAARIRIRYEGRRFNDGAAAGAEKPAATPVAPDGMSIIAAPLAGIVVALTLAPGSQVRRGDEVMLIEAMKMQHEVRAQEDGFLENVAVRIGQAVERNEMLALVRPAILDSEAGAGRSEIDLDHIRPDLGETIARKSALLDANRPLAVQRMRERGRRTARENVDDLCDSGSFHEFGGLVFAAQRARRSADELRAYSPADGMIAGIGAVNGEAFPPERTRCAVVAYDYTVFAGTQGALNHKKKDRIFDVAYRSKLPLVMFGGGGGGRPGETDIRLGLDISTFQRFAMLKSRAPIIAVVSGPCFAGNAALVGCADLLIATPDANIGMGGPAMIEGGGLGAVSTRDVGPVGMQAGLGVVDIVAADEREAVKLARQYLSYFQGPIGDFSAPDQRALRHVVPENRMRVYAIRDVINGLADHGSVLEVKPNFGPSMVTAMIRIGGQPMGVIANNPMTLSGAIDADAAEKAVSFLALCESFRLPLLSLCDTPGFMVGPSAEAAGQVKQSCKLFVQGAKLTVPLFAVVLRKAYGLGAQAMVGGSFHAPLFAVSWPTGEFGGMGFEGAVRLGFRKELEAIVDPQARDTFFQEKLKLMYEEGKALSVAEYMEIDDVIDPAATRGWIMQGLEAVSKIRG